MILAIDPGTTESGWCGLYRGRVLSSGVAENAEVLRMISDSCALHLCIEMIASYGMPVGKEVFETCVWIGRMQQAWGTRGGFSLIYRRDVKLHLCGTARAKDANIRQALIDKLGPPGTKKYPGGTYGVKSHAWAALAVAVTHHETKGAV